ncbi:MAG: type VI secretion protein IcmF/TssM N-terminal domain-containing protein [Pirellulaceae bacterium]
MYSLFSMIWKGLKWLGGAIVSPIKHFRDGDAVGRVLRWIAHFVFLVLAVVGLTALNYLLQLDKALNAPLPGLRLLWLPLLCLLAYGLIWLGWWICRVVSMRKEPSPFPDIDAAWNTAVRLLEKRGVDLERTPLFLTLGRPAGKEIHLFNAARLPLLTAPAPPESDAPLHVYATPDAVYIGCGEISLLGRQAARFAQAQLEAEQRMKHLCTRPAGCSTVAESSDVDVERIPIGDEGDVSSGGATTATTSTTATAAAAKTAAKPGTRTLADSAEGLSLVEQQVAMLVADDDERLEETFVEHEQTVLDPIEADLAEALLRDTAEAELISARLRHLCTLIGEQRLPFAPINGTLLLIPAAATDCERSANHVAVLAQKDLDTVRDALQVECAHVALVCDMEQSPGCPELVERFPADQRQRRLGVRFPRLAPNDISKAAAMIDQGVTWMCDELIPPLVFRLFPLGSPDADVLESDDDANAALYRFLYRMRARRERLTRILQRAICSDPHRPPMFGGCFLVATGADAQREQGFASAVFSQLVDMQDLGNWTDEAVEKNKRQTRWARIGYAALAGLAVILLVAVARM